MQTRDSLVEGDKASSTVHSSPDGEFGPWVARGQGTVKGQRRSVYRVVGSCCRSLVQSKANE